MRAVSILPLVCLLVTVMTTEHPCDIHQSQPLNQSDYVLLSNGTLKTNNSVLYSPDEFWKDEVTNEIRVCARKVLPSIFKCCPKGFVQGNARMCVPGDDSLIYRHNPTIQNTIVDEKRKITSLESYFNLLYGQPCTDGKFKLNADENPEDEHYLTENGSVLLTQTDEYIPPNEYCIEVMGSEIETFLCITGEEGEEVPINAMYVLYPTLMVISLPFFVITIFVYASVRTLRNVHGKCLISQSASLFIAYVSLMTGQIGTILRTISDELCTTVAFIIYFSFLASFFWLNVMCLDIWWTFSGFRPLRGSVKEREHKKFIIYSLYSWGCPLIMLIVAMVMDLYPGISDDYIKPKFGDQKCWFDDNTSALYYFVGPIAFLLVCNIALFIFTAIRIRQLKNETKILQRKDSKRHDDEDNNRQRFNLYLKLFLVMGVNWIMEIISWFAGGPEYLWYVTDIGNTLQGVLIFIIFVWKDRVRRLLMERFCPKRAMSGTAKSVVTSTRSITRSSPSRNNTLNTRPQTQERNSNHEDYRMKPLMETSCTDVP